MIEKTIQLLTLFMSHGKISREISLDIVDRKPNCYVTSLWENAKSNLAQNIFLNVEPEKAQSLVITYDKTTLSAFIRK